MTYKTNFHKGKTGNVLHVGEDLTIKRGDVCEYIIGRLFRIDDNGNQILLQIEQTGSRQNPETNSITFELKERENGKTTPMSPGSYKVSCYAYIIGAGGSRFSDDFEIE